MGAHIGKDEYIRRAYLMAEMIREGRTCKQIARELRVHRATVSRGLALIGWPLKSRPKRLQGEARRLRRLWLRDPDRAYREHMSR